MGTINDIKWHDGTMARLIEIILKYVCGKFAYVGKILYLCIIDTNPHFL